jgi:dienelactone hydrolase
MIRKPDSIKEVPGKWKRRLVLAGWFVFSLLFLGSATLPIMIPFFQLPAPTGDLKVGTHYYHFKDPKRPESFTADPSDIRQVGVKVWYPALVRSSDVTESYLPLKACRSMARFYNALFFQFDDYTIIPTHSVSGATVNAKHGPYPVIIFSHAGGSGHMSQSVALTEDLASHGYIVFAVGHAHETPYLVKSQGEVVTFSPTNEKRLQLIADANIDLSFYVTRILNTSDPDEQRQAWYEIISRTPNLAECENIRANDIHFLINQLDSLNEFGESLRGTMDLGRLGIIGHSGGGATATRICIEDNQFRAGINMDGRQLTNQLHKRLTRPFMFMTSQWEDYYSKEFRIINEYYFAQAAAPVYKLLIRGSKHANFSDLSLQGPLLKWAGVIGDIDGERFTYIQNKFVVAFFNQYLKGKNSPLLKGPPSDFPEVEIFSKNVSESEI